MLWRLSKELHACAIVKGYRNEKDLAYENMMATYNREHNPQAETILLKADENLVEISSTAVREKILAGEDLHPYLPIAVIEEIYKIFPKQL